MDIIVTDSLDRISEVLAVTLWPRMGKKRTYIIQKYIENPLLVYRRKFDIRCYALVTSFNGVIQAYFYKDGYLRTSCKEFSLKTDNRFIHLTNDAVQKQWPDYNKFEVGNKMSYMDF